MTKTVGTWLIEAHERLKQITETADLDAQVLLASTLNKDRSWVLAHPEHILADSDIIQLADTLGLLSGSVPLPYITGMAHFYGLEFHVTPDVLIPRPETELLVEYAIQWCQKHQYNHYALDVGTGSGCIAVSLAVHTPHLKVIAIDRSLSALRIANHNSKFHRVDGRCQLIQSDLISPIYGKFGLICANLPYIPTHRLNHLQVAKVEPLSALDGGEFGLDLIQKLLAGSVRIAADKVCLLFEIESEQGKPALSLAEKYYPDAEFKVLRDLSGLDRLLVIERD